MTKIFCFGDSNTYGYDPRDPFGGRYDVLWCELLAQKSGWKVINCGENGRTIPTHEITLSAFAHKVENAGDIDVILIMLGSNDVMTAYKPTPEMIASRMAAFLDYVQNRFPDKQIVVLSPPVTKVPDETINNCIKQLSHLYCEAADKHSANFVDIQSWPLELAFDGVHLSEKDNRVFADMLYDELLQIIK